VSAVKVEIRARPSDWPVFGPERTRPSNADPCQQRALATTLSSTHPFTAELAYVMPVHSAVEGTTPVVCRVITVICNANVVLASCEPYLAPGVDHGSILTVCVAQRNPAQPPGFAAGPRVLPRYMKARSPIAPAV
jgi:hypothetical protein